MIIPKKVNLKIVLNMGIDNQKIFYALERVGCLNIIFNSQQNICFFGNRQ